MIPVCLTGQHQAPLVTIYLHTSPHKYILSNTSSILQKYATDYGNTSENKIPLLPHTFQLANNTYYYMRRTTQDQSIVIRYAPAHSPFKVQMTNVSLFYSGETGSGKSESRHLAIKMLLELSISNPGRKGSKLVSQAPTAESVIESFRDAHTLFNSNASHFGKYTELQFTDKGCLCGIKLLGYYLKHNWVVVVPSGECNFHIS